MRKVLLVTSAISILALAWLIFQLENQSRCFDSAWLSQILVVQATDNHKVVADFPVCPDYRWKHPGFEWKELELRLREDLADFDQLIDLTHQPIEPIRLEIVQSPDLAFAQERRKVVLGEKLALAKGQILKALVQQWLLQINSDFLNHKLLSEVLSDFFISTIHGSMKVTNPLNGSTTELASTLKFENYNFSFKEICYSPWVPGSHLALCASLDRINGTSVFRDKNFKILVEAVDRMMTYWSPYSLRPVFGYLLWRSYMNSGLNDRLSIVRTLAGNLRVKIPEIYDWEENVSENNLEGEIKSALEKRETQVFVDTESLIEFWQKEI